MKGRTETDWTLRPPFVDLTEMRVQWSVTREIAQEPVAVVPTGRLRNGNPRKDESLFASRAFANQVKSAGRKARFRIAGLSQAARKLPAISNSSGIGHKASCDV